MNDYYNFKFSPATWILPTILVIFTWIVFFIDSRFNLDLYQFGIMPRTLFGLKGIVFSPFLHSDLSHIANNSIPLFVLSLALVYFYRQVSLKVLFYGILLSGIGTWLIGRESFHIGASGLIYVLVSFIFFKGLLTKYYRLMALSFAVVLLYGGMIWYVFPLGNYKVSWEGHLAGFLSGLFFAIKFKIPDYVTQIQYPWQSPDFHPEEDDFMKRFDENGNFVNPPKIEEEEVLDSEIDKPQPLYIYHFIENRNENLE